MRGSTTTSSRSEIRDTDDGEDSQQQNDGPAQLIVFCPERVQQDGAQGWQAQHDGDDDTPTDQGGVAWSRCHLSRG